MALTIRTALADDILALAQMNKRLIEDEGHRNPMSIPELEQRMRRWLQNDWRADLFLQSNTEEDTTLVGYALYQHRKDEYTPDCPEVYLRQFFIERPYRSQGLGRLAIQMLFSTRFAPRCTVVVDVLAANQRGLHFWKQVGFQPYQTTLKARVGG